MSHQGLEITEYNNLAFLERWLHFIKPNLNYVTAYFLLNTVFKPKLQLTHLPHSYTFTSHIYVTVTHLPHTFTSQIHIYLTHLPHSYTLPHTFTSQLNIYLTHLPHSYTLPHTFTSQLHITSHIYLTVTHLPYNYTFTSQFETIIFSNINTSVLLTSTKTTFHDLYTIAGCHVNRVLQG